MIRREQAIPGARLIVVDKIRTGLHNTANHADEKELLLLRDLNFTGNMFGAPPGAELEVLKAPKKVGSSDIAKVKIVSSGEEGYAYWGMLRLGTRLKED